MTSRWLNGYFPIPFWQIQIASAFLFIFICKPESRLPKGKFRYILFEVINENETQHQFNSTHKFWENVWMREEFIKKLGYFSIESTHDPYFPTVAVNQKGLRKSVSGMKFENYSKQINSIRETKIFGQLPEKKHKQYRFLIKKNEMKCLNLPK